MNGPIQFSVVGRHPLLLVTRDHLIRTGFELVPLSSINFDRPWFFLCGGEPSTIVEVMPILTEVGSIQGMDGPVLLLSSSSVYGDRDINLSLREEVPCDEGQGLTITSSLDPEAFRSTTALLVETLLANRKSGKTLILRPFNVYGPGIPGVVSTFFAQALAGEPLTVHAPGRQTRSFLFVEDYLHAVTVTLSLLLGGGRGIYNVGSSDRAEIQSLAKSVGHALRKQISIELVPQDAKTRRHMWWKLPDITRLRALKWRPKYSLRSGLFRMAGR